MRRRSQAKFGDIPPTRRHGINCGQAGSAWGGKECQPLCTLAALPQGLSLSKGARQTSHLILRITHRLLDTPLEKPMLIPERTKCKSVALTMVILTPRPTRFAEKCFHHSKAPRVRHQPSPGQGPGKDIINQIPSPEGASQAQQIQPMKGVPQKAQGRTEHSCGMGYALS